MPGNSNPTWSSWTSMMPGINGLEVCRRLRAADGNLPFLMLTARDGAPDQVLGLETGVRPLPAVQVGGYGRVSSDPDCSRRRIPIKGATGPRRSGLSHVGLARADADCT